MAGLTYTTYKTQIAQMAVVSETDVNFLAILPMMLNYAELRICRDLDLIFTSVSLYGAGYQLTAGNRNLSFSQNLPNGTSFVVSEQINLITPAGQTNPNTATRTPLLPTTKEFLDAVYGSAINTAQPKYFVPFNETLFLVGPTPNADYYVEVVGTVRPASLDTRPVPNPSNLPPDLLNQTFISQYLPDLLVMASMIYISAYQRNFGKESDDPQMAMSYESQYQLLLKSAVVEENRKKFEAAGWSSQSPATVASPTRG
jgi:hypothetical protein